MEYTCKQCNASFTEKRSLVRHVKDKHGNASFKCEHCEKLFSRKDALNRHEKTHLIITCEFCHRVFPGRRHYTVHRQTCSPVQPVQVTLSKAQASTSAIVNAPQPDLDDQDLPTAKRTRTSSPQPGPSHVQSKPSHTPASGSR